MGHGGAKYTADRADERRPPHHSAELTTELDGNARKGGPHTTPQGLTTDHADERGQGTSTSLRCAQ